MTKKDLETIYYILIYERCDECPLDDICRHWISQGHGRSICGRLTKIHSGETPYQFEK